MNIFRSKFGLFSNRKDGITASEWPEIGDQMIEEVEQTRNFTTEWSKKAQKLNLFQVAEDKVSKKSPEYASTICLKESLEKLRSPQLKLLLDSATILSETYERVATLRGAFECQSEADMFNPLQNLGDKICADLSKKRRNLIKFCNDQQICKEKLDAARQYVDQTARNNLDRQILPRDDAERTKVLNSLAEYEKLDIDCTTYSTVDSLNKLYQSHTALESLESEVSRAKDDLLTDLFQFRKSENEHAQIMLNHLRSYSKFLELSLKEVQTRIPNLEGIIEARRVLFCYGRELDQHLTETNRELAYVLQHCINFLDDKQAYKEVGLFRVAGQKSKIKLLKQSLDVMQGDPQLCQSCGFYAVADALKQYLRDLPVPLLGSVQNKANSVKWQDALANNSLEQAKQCLGTIPGHYLTNIGFLMRFLHKVASNHAVSKMDASNLCLVIGPNLFHISPSSDNMTSLLKDYCSKTVQFLIMNAPELFPELKMRKLSRASSSYHPPPPLLPPTKSSLSEDSAKNAPKSTDKPRAEADETASTNDRIYHLEETVPNVLASNIQNNTNLSEIAPAGVQQGACSRKKAPAPPRPCHPTASSDNSSSSRRESIDSCSQYASNFASAVSPEEVPEDASSLEKRREQLLEAYANESPTYL